MILERNLKNLAALAAVIILSTTAFGAGCSDTPSRSTSEQPAMTKDTAAEQKNPSEPNDTADAATHVEIDTKPTSSVPKPSVSTTTTKPVATIYKDGTYSATGAYNSPAGLEELPVKLTIKADVVTASDVTVVATNPKSKYMQQQFASGYKQYVIGKKIDEINVGKVSGSSLTGIGFNDAVAKIKTQARIK